MVIEASPGMEYGHLICYEHLLRDPQLWQTDVLVV